MRRSLLPLVFVLLAACTPRPEMPTSIEAGNSAVLAEQVDWLTEDGVKKGGSMVAAVYQDGSLLHFSGAGELPSGELPTEQTLFRAGSISKMFTALAVLQLHESGDLDLDRPLVDQLPGFTIQSRFDSPRAITPRNMLSHHAGLPSDRMPGLFSDDAPDFTEHLGALVDEQVTHAPGEWWAYSNLGYSLLGHLIEEASGQDFAAYVTDNIFAPCGMANSSWRWNDAVSGTIDGVPTSEGGGISMTPAGGLVTSIEDLGKFAQGLIEGGVCPDGRILSTELLEEAWAPANYAALDLDFTWGLGFFVVEGADWLDGERVVGHTGSTLLFGAQILIAPELGLTAIAMTNEAGLTAAATRIALEGLQLGTETLGNARPKSLPAPLLFEREESFTEAELESFEGVYGTLIDVMEVKRAGDGLVSTIQGQTVRMIPTTERTFILRPKVGFLVLPIDVIDLEFAFTKIDETMVMGIRGDMTTMSWMPFGSRFEPATAEGAWADRLGVWMPTHGEDDYYRVSELRLTDEAGFLALSVDKVSPVSTDQVGKGLLPLGDDQACTAGTGRDAGETVWIEQTDQGELLHYLGYRFERQAEEGSMGCSAVSPASPSSVAPWAILLAGLFWLIVRRRRAPEPA